MGCALATLADRINEEHEAAELAVNRALEHALNAGHLLIEAKGQVSHGEWQPWVESHFRGSYRTAAVYMRIARRWTDIEANRQDSALLSIDGALKLLAEPRQREPLTAHERAQLEQAEATIEKHLPELREIGLLDEEFEHVLIQACGGQGYPSPPMWLYGIDNTGGVAIRPTSPPPYEAFDIERSWLAGMVEYSRPGRPVPGFLIPKFLDGVRFDWRNAIWCHREPKPGEQLHQDWVGAS